jgi:hypothetical protein
MEFQLSPCTAALGCTSVAGQEIHRCRDQGKFCNPILLQNRASKEAEAFVSAVRTDLKMLHIYTPGYA